MAVNVDGLIHIKTAVRTPTQSVQQMMGILRAESRQHHPFFISAKITIAIAEMSQFGTIGDIDTAIPRYHARGNEQPLGKDASLFRNTVTVDIFNNHNFVSRLLAWFDLGIDFATGDP